MISHDHENYYKMIYYKFYRSSTKIDIKLLLKENKFKH